MRLVIVTGTDPVDPRGGIGTAVGGVVDALSTTGMDFEVVPSYRPGSTHGRTILAVKAAWTIAVKVREARRNGRVPIVYAHGGRAVGLLRQSLVLAVARWAGARTVLHLHSVALLGYARSRMGRAFVRGCLSPTELTLVLSGYWKEALRRCGVRGPVAVVPNAVGGRDDMQAARGRHRELDGSVRLVTMARLVPGKGVDLAIRTMEALPHDILLTVAGDGPQRKELERLRDSLGLTARVTFAGWISGSPKYRLLRQSDVFFLPTRFDSFGMGFVEAMAEGLPIVALRWGPVPDVVGPDYGILVDSASPRALAEAICLLRDPQKRERMGAACHARFSALYSPPAVGSALMEALARLDP